MVTRESKVGAPRAAAPIKAADVPVTRAMLGSVRTELLQRIDQAREEGKADIQKLDAKIDAVKAELKGDLLAVKAELKGDIHAVKADLHEVKADLHEVKADLHEVKADLHNVKAAMHGMQAQMARIELLVEEQNARNKIVLDGITALLSRQEHLEQRMVEVEGTIRKIASAPRST